MQFKQNNTHIKSVIIFILIL